MPRPDAAPAIAVFCSGQGTNLQAILQAIHRGTLRARVALVVSDQPKAKAIARASRAGVPSWVVEPGDYSTRAEYERVLIRRLDALKIRVVCLAGFMRVLSPVFVNHFCGRLLNIHPALLPAFPGAHAVRDALAWGAKVTGVTVHFVDAEVDYGPIVLQEAVPVNARDTEASLLKKVHQIEHRLYPKALQLVLDGRTKLVGRTVLVTGTP